MKHIRKFNESDEVRYPKKVTQKEFFHKKSIFKMKDFSYNEKKTMCDILNEKSKKIHLSWSTSSDFIEIYRDRQFWEIVKLDDDWFTIIYTYWNTDEYYICDEFEEVVNFLKLI